MEPIIKYATRTLGSPERIREMIEKEMEVWRTAFKTVTYPVEYPGGVAANLDELMSAFEKWSGIDEGQDD